MGLLSHALTFLFGALLLAVANSGKLCPGEEKCSRSQVLADIIVHSRQPPCYVQEHLA